MEFSLLIPVKILEVYLIETGWLGFFLTEINSLFSLGTSQYQRMLAWSHILEGRE